MDNQQKCLDFIQGFDDVLNKRPGMLGSVAEISAMFFVIDNFKNILLFGESLPRELSWYEFLIEKKLLRNLKPIPVEDNWDFEKFIELRHQYLQWVDDHLGADVPVRD